MWRRSWKRMSGGPAFFEERLERGRGDITEVQRLAGRDAEDEVVVLPQVAELEPLGVLGCFMGLERIDGPPREPYAAALAVLRRREGRAALGLGSSAPYTQGTGIEIDIFPLEAQELTDPQTRRHGEHVEGFEALPTRRF